MLQRLFDYLDNGKVPNWRRSSVMTLAVGLMMFILIAALLLVVSLVSWLFQVLPVACVVIAVPVVLHVVLRLLGRNGFVQYQNDVYGERLTHSFGRKAFARR